jgi:hypothetical protein
VSDNRYISYFLHENAPLNFAQRYGYLVGFESPSRFLPKTGQMVLIFNTQFFKN